MALIVTLALPGDRDPDHGVGDDDDGQRDEVHHDHAENGVRRLVRRWRERVECHALGVPCEFRMGLHVENVHLEK